MNPGLLGKIRRVAPYVPGEQPKDGVFVKLNTNENPYPPSPKVMEAYSSIDSALFPKYPDPDSGALCRAVAARHGLQSDQVFPGNGSDEVLALAFLTFFNGDLPVMFPDITYSFYPVWCDLFQIPYTTAPLDERFRINPEHYIVSGEKGGIVIANPNAPTAICEDLHFVESVLAYNPGCVVIVDEAYIDFGGVSAAELIGRYENLLVVHTLSKIGGLAGIRVGYAMGCSELIACLNDVKNAFNSYTLNVISQKMGTAALEDAEYYRDCARKIVDTRAWFIRALSDMGFVSTDSSANFVFVSHPEHDARTLFDGLRRENILVRYFNKERIQNHLRISIGTDEEMELVVRALERILKTSTNNTTM